MWSASWPRAAFMACIGVVELFMFAGPGLWPSHTLLQNQNCGVVDMKVEGLIEGVGH